jgi:hypothetical protein
MMSAVSIDGESSLIVYGGPAVYLGGTDDAMIDLGQTSIAENQSFKGKHSAFAIVANGQVRGLRYGGNVENLNQLLMLNDKAIGMDLSGSIPAKADEPLIMMGGNKEKCAPISSSIIRVRLA